MDKQFELDKRYLRMARIWSENSYAIRRQVGALVVKDRMIISDGYNGTPAGFENVCEKVVCECTNPSECCRAEFDPEMKRHMIANITGRYYPEDKGVMKCYESKCRFAKLVTKPYVLHAEANAISKLARSGNNSEGATLYVTDEPCLDCAKMIIQAGIKRVVFWREYHSHEGTQLLLRAKIKIDQISNIN